MSTKIGMKVIFSQKCLQKTALKVIFGKMSTKVGVELIFSKKRFKKQP